MTLVARKDNAGCCICSQPSVFSGLLSFSIALSTYNNHGEQALPEHAMLCSQVLASSAGLAVFLITLLLFIIHTSELAIRLLLLGDTTLPLIHGNTKLRTLTGKT